jgi:Holliday junction resolvase-like predicted endonuclease
VTPSNRKHFNPAGHRSNLGRLGEQIAEGFLERRGVTILDRNVAVGRGEIDLVAVDDSGRFVVEVKTATERPSDHPRDHFTPRKRRQVGDLAATMGVGRVDLVTVVAGPSAFRWTGTNASEFGLSSGAIQAPNPPSFAVPTTVMPMATQAGLVGGNHDEMEHVGRDRSIAAGADVVLRRPVRLDTSNADRRPMWLRRSFGVLVCHVWGSRSAAEKGPGDRGGGQEDGSDKQRDITELFLTIPKRIQAHEVMVSRLTTDPVSGDPISVRSAAELPKLRLRRER